MAIGLFNEDDMYSCQYLGSHEHCYYCGVPEGKNVKLYIDDRAHYICAHCEALEEEQMDEGLWDNGDDE